MKTGMTIKQFARNDFFNACEAYREALLSGVNIVAASVRVHAAKGGVPKSYWPIVNRIYRTAKGKA